METIDKLNPRDVAAAHIMLLNNLPPKPVDGLFFYGRSFGDETGLFELAADLYKDLRVGKIAIVNSMGEKLGSKIPFEAHIGKDEFRRRLVDLGVPTEDIVVPDQTGYHTRQETDAFLQLARQRGWKSAVAISQPHQVLRAMLGTVRAMDQLGHKMEIYTAHPKNTNWHEVVKGSQGAESKRRIDHISDELKRIPDYQSKGDLASFEELFSYLEDREKGLL